MGRMQDALRKAAEERERKLRQRGADVAGEEVRGPVAAPGSDPLPPPPEGRQRTAPPPQADPERPADVSPAAPLPPGPPPERKDPRPDRGPAGRAAGAAVQRTGEQPVRSPASERRYGVDPRVVAFHAPNDPRAEQFRTIRTGLLGIEPLPRTVMVASGSPREGKSLAVANLAASLVEGGRRRVLIVDANFRNPAQDQILAARTGRGLSDILADPATDPGNCIVGTAIPGVDLLAAGTQLGNPGALLLPRAVADVLAVVEPAYDFVLVDVPSLEEYADASVVAGDVDGVLLVLQIDGPPRRAAERAVEILESARARVLGAIATNCRE